VSDDSTTQCLLFPKIFGKPVVLQFDQLNGSSDGGAILLKAADRRYGLIQSLAGCLRDKRQAGKVDHSLRELLSQRVSPVPVQTPVLPTVDFVPLPEPLAVYARRSPPGTSLRCSTKPPVTTSTS